MIASTIKAVWGAIGPYCPEPVPCPTCKSTPIVTILKDGKRYRGHIECSPETRRIKECVLVNPGEHVHFDYSNPCKTPEEAYDSAIKTWNGHLSGTLDRGKRFPEIKRRKDGKAKA